MYGLVLQPVMLFVISCSKSQGRDCQGVRVVTARGCWCFDWGRRVPLMSFSVQRPRLLLAPAGLLYVGLPHMPLFQTEDPSERAD
jgi:hypothetical protein